MIRRLLDFWRKENGASTGLEWVLVGEVLILGSVIAVIAIRRALLGDG
jgi:hypothetical protein